MAALLFFLSLTTQDPEKVVIAQEQGNFIQGLCMPLYKALVNLFPTAQPCCDQMASNKAIWDKKYARGIVFWGFFVTCYFFFLHCRVSDLLVWT
jgi:hypothetical protein